MAAWAVSSPARGGPPGAQSQPRGAAPAGYAQPSPRNSLPHTLAPPGTRNSASLGLWGRYGGGPGLGPGGPAPRPRGNRRYGPASRPRPCAFFVSAWSSTVSGPPPASAGSPRRALLGCSWISKPRSPLTPARRRLPGPVESSKPGASRTAGPASARSSKLRLWSGGGMRVPGSPPSLLRHHSPRCAGTPERPVRASAAVRSLRPRGPLPPARPRPRTQNTAPLAPHKTACGRSPAPRWSPAPTTAASRKQALTETRHP